MSQCVYGRDTTDVQYICVGDSLPLDMSCLAQTKRQTLFKRDTGRHTDTRAA